MHPDNVLGQETVECAACGGVLRDRSVLWLLLTGSMGGDRRSGRTIFFLD
jgi:hypothetical protein